MWVLIVALIVSEFLGVNQVNERVVLYLGLVLADDPAYGGACRLEHLLQHAHDQLAVVLGRLLEGDSLTGTAAEVTCELPEGRGGNVKPRQSVMVIDLQ